MSSAESSDLPANDHLSDPQFASFAKLDLAEVFWRDRYHALYSRGYRLRDRYHPNWFPSWIRAGTHPFNSEDAFRLPPRWGLIDATKIDDGRLVYLKYIRRDSDEFALIHYLSADGRRDDPRNHCVPLLDTVLDPLDETHMFIVMPFLRYLDNPPFENVGEFLDFGEQILEGLVYLHEQGVAHRDCAYKNVMMDASAMYPDGFHPIGLVVVPDRSAMAWPIPRSDTTVRYYFTDFGISVYFPPHVTERLAEGEDGLDQDPPELHQDRPYDPFKLDVFIIGNLFKKSFLDVFSNLGFLSALVDKMTRPNPDLRPTAEQVLEEWHDAVRNVSFITRRWRLRERQDPLHVRLTMDVYGWLKTGLSGTNLRRYL